MPIYEFACEKCLGRFETLIRLGAEKSVVCPACGSSRIKKQTSCFGIGGGSSRLKKTSSGCTTCSTKSCSTCR